MNLKINNDNLLNYVVLIKILGTIYALYVFGSFSSLADSNAYLSGQHNSADLFSSRTMFIGYIATLLKSIFSFDILVHLFISVLVAYFIWYAIKDIWFTKIEIKLFLFSLMSPSFLVWSGIITKEAITLIGLGLMTNGFVSFLLYNRLKKVNVIIGFFLVAFIRPNYFIAYFSLFLIVFIYAKSQIKKLSKSIWLLMIFILCLSVLLIIFIYMSKIVENFMYMSQHMFLAYGGNSNRYWITWSSIEDLGRNLWWGVPFSLIGPLPSEVLNRPLMTPFFLEGIVFFLFSIYLLFRAHNKCKRNKHLYKLFIFLFLTVIFGVLIHYPLGIFNPGSALRYKQSLYFLLYIFPLIIPKSIIRVNFRFRAATIS